MEPPTDIGEPQAEFEDAVCRRFESDGSGFEVLDRNMSSDPFEPDLVVMDSDEWVFRIVCYYIEDPPSDGTVVLFPRTFGMRKWVTDSDETPTFLVFGIGGTPQNPEMLFFGRFFEFPDQVVDLKNKMQHLVSCFRIDLLGSVVERELERIYSP